jgi:hypothetical protein
MVRIFITKSPHISLRPSLSMQIHRERESLEVSAARSFSYTDRVSQKNEEATSITSLGELSTRTEHKLNLR